MEEVELNLDLIGPDQARAIIGNYKYSTAKLNAHIRARAALYTQFPAEAAKVETMAWNLTQETARRAGIRDTLDLNTLAAALRDLVFGGYAHSYGLITQEDLDVLDKACKGVIG